MNPSKLVILDLSGLFVHKELFLNVEIKDRPEVTSKYKYEDAKSMRLFFLPDVEEFVSNLMKTYDVAVWSSTTYHNAISMLNGLLTKETMDKLIFKWFRDRTELDPEHGIRDDISEHATIKNIERVIYCPTINYDRKYNLSNIVIVDDSFDKIRFNSYNNIIVEESFKLNLEHTEDYENKLEILRTKIDDKFSSITD